MGMGSTGRTSERANGSAGRRRSKKSARTSTRASAPGATRASPRRKVCVVTGSRAEFGLLLPIIRAIDAHERLRLFTLVTGTHLTIGTDRDIEAAGVHVTRRVPMQQATRVGRAADVQALGRGVHGLGEPIEQIDPTFVLVLGDRIEAFAAACAASIGGRRLVHLHGGDRAEGVADEAMRHAITKIASLHLPATKASARRIVRMGEDESRVHVVGSPAIDGLAGIEPAEDAPDAIVMQHPIGDSDAIEKRRMLGTLAATQKFHRLVMAPNRDPGCEGVDAAIRQRRIAAVTHLPREPFLSLLAGAKVIVGNSSAGLIEAAALRIPCVNVGPRQRGRERPGHVVDCGYGAGAVREAIARALSLDLRRLRHPYGAGDAGPRAAELLATLELDTAPVRKVNRY